MPTSLRNAFTGQLRRYPGARLLAVKLAHTGVWAFFVATILGIWVAASLRRFGIALICIAIVLVEVAVLLFNHWRCPLTDVAARYTPDRRANFDIFLPERLARYNKEVFGSLFVLAILYTLFRWRFVV